VIARTAATNERLPEGDGNARAQAVLTAEQHARMQ
jgi:hypothetical protein